MMKDECIYCTLEEAIVAQLSLQRDGTILESFLFYFVLRENRGLSMSYNDFEAAVSMLEKEGRIVINTEECDEPEITLVSPAGTA